MEYTTQRGSDLPRVTPCGAGRCRVSDRGDGGDMHLQKLDTFGGAYHSGAVLLCRDLILPTY